MQINQNNTLFTTQEFKEMLTQNTNSEANSLRYKNPDFASREEYKARLNNIFDKFLQNTTKEELQHLLISTFKYSLVEDWLKNNKVNQKSSQN